MDEPSWQLDVSPVIVTTAVIKIQIQRLVDFVARPLLLLDIDCMQVVRPIILVNFIQRIHIADRNVGKRLPINVNINVLFYAAV